MPDGQVLEFSGVTKRFGAVTAVSGLTARVEPGVVTGFLGPNGAGKTTSLRILLGLVRATDGAATIGGERYAQLARPMHSVGAVLEASSFHPGRTGAAHLNVYAQAGRIPKPRVDEVLGLVGLADAAGRKVGGYSLGMRQRLGLAYALLGDPGVLVLDEPTNGLDPEGIKWIRGFLRQLAGEGRTVFVSSHLLSEVQQTVDSLLIISRGRLVFQGALEDLADPEEQATVVDSPDRAALAEALRTAGLSFEVLRSGLTVRGVDPVSVGQAAAGSGVALSSLQRRGPMLEEVFLDLVDGIRVHPSATGESSPGADVRAREAVAAGSAADAEVADAEVADAEHGAPSAHAEPESVPTADAEHDGIDDVVVAGDDVAREVIEPSDAAYAGEQVTGEIAETGAPASFSVAATGVIDIIPVTPDVETPGSDQTEGSEDLAQPEGSEDLAEPEGSEDLAEPRSPEGPERGDAHEDDAVEEHVASDADDRPWEDYVKTDADVEADRFFAGFENHDPAAVEPAPHDPDADEPPGDEPPANETVAEQPADADAARSDHEGSEQR
ncbi:MAG: ATP-binding cassette domain-containing protein [Microbacterium sp.]